MSGYWRGSRKATRCKVSQLRHPEWEGQTEGVSYSGVQQGSSLLGQTHPHPRSILIDHQQLGCEQDANQETFRACAADLCEP